MMKNKFLLWGIVAIIFGTALLSLISGLGLTRDTFVLGYEGEVIQYKSPGCGCCTGYEEYLRKRSDLSIKVVEVEDISSLKDQFDIPREMRSCHVLVFGDYFIEGHVPLEAIVKLLEEKPDIAGITLPGMPSGTPGMPGPNKGPWVIYAVHHDGTSTEFMTI